MNEDQITKDYAELEQEYLDFQDEIYTLLANFQAERKESIDILEVKKRPGGIKTLMAVKGKISRKGDKYKKVLDVRDIAGVRLVCHCEDDRNIAVSTLGGILKQAGYFNISEPDEKKDMYRAVHIDFSKKIQYRENEIDIYAEVQIRTVMQEAWAIQDTKYNHKKIEEGERVELADAVSQIMHGCEKLWILVKEKSKDMSNDGAYDTPHTIKNLEVRKPLIPKNISDNANLTWFRRHETVANLGLKGLDINTYMEVKVRLLDENISLDKSKLFDSAKKSTIRTFGWPLGVFIEREEYKPKPDSDGMYAQLSIKRKDDWGDGIEREEKSYDYWAINRNGSFFLKKSIFEDKRNPKAIFFDTRIIRITELLMYIRNLYKSFGVLDNSKFEVTIKHGGLKGRILKSAGDRRPLYRDYVIDLDEAETTIECSLTDIDNNIPDLVEIFTKDLFSLFDFFELGKEILSEISLNYVNGKVV